MSHISVIVCTHNPREDYFRRVLAALRDQTLPMSDWELLIVDNASAEPVASRWDISWQENGRHVRENVVGLAAARLKGISETSGDLVVFADDDNVLASTYLERAREIHAARPYLGVFGAGSIEPEFEAPQPDGFAAHGSALTLRTVRAAKWSNNPLDYDSTPWGAGLCIGRPVADAYERFVRNLGEVATVLGPRGKELFRGDDDLFSWVAVSLGMGFGIFPALGVTHLIPGDRLNRRYLLSLLYAHEVSHSVLRYRLAGRRPRKMTWASYVHLLLHGIRNGPLSMRCKWAEWSGEDRAARFVLEAKLEPAQLLGDIFDFASSPQGHSSGDVDG